MSTRAAQTGLVAKGKKQGPGNFACCCGYAALDPRAMRERMANSLVTLDIDRSVATLTMDDGKRNALSPAMFDEIYAAPSAPQKRGGHVELPLRCRVGS